MSIRGKKVVKETLHDILRHEDQEKNPINPEDVIFALDIGTRNVVGIVGIEEDGVFNVVDIEVVEHKSRAMMDGQIHEISKVVEVVEIVKERLESRLGFELIEVAIAAAGRSLRTNSVTVERKLDKGITITQDIVNSLELEGVQIAYENLHKNKPNDEDTQYYCIGHTVINYYLNGYVISNLIGHKGKRIEANVLATFLPYTVIDSLYSVMERVGLKVISVTLEPIAAINVSIPQDIRMLNLALVDIGAGTSDIAITRDGAIIAYAMCPVAGDEVTEKIAQHYLLDFNTAERIKKETKINSSVEFNDIMGLSTKIDSSEVVKVLEPASKHLAEVIAEKIIECNGKEPNGVFCIGGGSQTSGLTKYLAEKLGIPIERVGVRGTEIIRNIKFTNKKLTGPEAITPIGIAITALMKIGHDFIKVKVNKKKVKLFNSGRVTIGDAIAASGVTPEQLIPRSGPPLTFELNRKKHTVRGGYGKVAEIYVNNTPANLETLISDGDQIKIIPSQKGQPAQALVGDFISDYNQKIIIFNNNKLDICTKAILNGKPASPDQPINEGDRLVVEYIKTIKDLAKICDMDLNKMYFTVNCSRVDEDYVITSGDIIRTVYKTEQDTAFTESDNTKESKTDHVNSSEIIDDISCEGNKTKEIIESSQESNEKLQNDKVSNKHKEDQHKNEISVYVNNDIVKLQGKSKYIFIDIFNHFKIDLSNPQGRVKLRLNSKPASFTDVIKDGDNIEISWH